MSLKLPKPWRGFQKLGARCGDLPPIYESPSSPSIFFGSLQASETGQWALHCPWNTCLDKFTHCDSENCVCTEVEAECLVAA